MGKLITVLFMVLLMLAAATGFFLLSGAIRSGEEQMTAGQGRLDRGQVTLDEGRVDLAEGKQKLAEGKAKYEDAQDKFVLVWLDKLLNAGKGFKDAEDRVDEGNRKVAKGEDKVAAGQERMDLGESKLSRGRERLLLARRIRMGCAVAAICLGALSIVFGFRWRRSLAGIFVPGH